MEIQWPSLLPALFSDFFVQKLTYSLVAFSSIFHRKHAAPTYIINVQNETTFETPVGSPEIVHDSDSEYDSLKRILEKIRLGKYFQKFKANAIMGEDLKYISEGELANVSSI